MTFNYRKYNKEKDLDHVFRILNEIGWVDDKKNSHYLNDFIPKGNALVTELNGEAEAMVVSSDGTIQHLENQLKLSAITGVTCSLVARKQQIAGKLTATRIALDAEKGAEVSALTIFDQGFYDKLGFGTSSYSNIVEFNPGELTLKGRHRVPKRFTKDDLTKIHNSRLNRMKVHGQVTLPEYTTYTDLSDEKKRILLGYENEKGEITHMMNIWGKGRENGPFWVNWMVYQNIDQLKELLLLLKSMSDQIFQIGLIEPHVLQFQDILRTPFKNKDITAKSKYRNMIRSSAYAQFRILDLEKCLAKTSLPQIPEEIRFNLELTDPIEKFIPESCNWKGISGNYCVTFGEFSGAVKGCKENLPTMKTDVNSFTRLWLGHRNATQLSLFDNFEAPQELIDKLDKYLCLPKASHDYDF
jgi:predicted acetyltransferase